jgi:hypothetical protein
VYRLDIVHEATLERTAAVMGTTDRELLRRLVWVAGRAPEAWQALERDVEALDA